MANHNTVCCILLVGFDFQLFIVQSSLLNRLAIADYYSCCLVGHWDHSQTAICLINCNLCYSYCNISSVAVYTVYSIVTIYVIMDCIVVVVLQHPILKVLSEQNMHVTDVHVSIRVGVTSLIHIFCYAENNIYLIKGMCPKIRLCVICVHSYTNILLILYSYTTPSKCGEKSRHLCILDEGIIRHLPRKCFTYGDATLGC